MKKIVFSGIMITGLLIGMALPNSSEAYMRHFQTKCWSAQIAGAPNDGYYRCDATGNGCTWIDGAKKDGDHSLCNNDPVIGE